MKKFVTYLPPENSHDFPRVTFQFGYRFPAGEAVEVSDPKSLRKLAGNKLFVVADEPVGKRPPSSGDAEALSAARAEIDHLKSVITDGLAANERQAEQIKSLTEHLQAAKAENERLKSELDAATAQLEELTKQQAESQQPKAGSKK